MTPFEIIEQLRVTSSTNAKREILANHKNDKLFQMVLTQIFDPRITFNIKKIPEYTPDEWSDTLPLDRAIDSLQALSARLVTGKKASEYLADILSKCSEEDAQVIKWIIAKDCKAGFGESLINDEMAPFSVYEVPYMGAVSYNKKKVEKLFCDHDYCISEVKMDGRYLNVIVRDEIFMESRGGKPNPLMGALEKEARIVREMLKMDVVLNGELMMKQVLQGLMDRYTSNGIIASYVSIAQKEFDGQDITKEAKKFAKDYHMTLQEAKEDITMVVWDFIPHEDYIKGSWNQPRRERLRILERVLKATQAFPLIEYKIVNSHAEAVLHFQEMLARGEEGTILKGSEGIWKDGKPNWQSKMKLEIDLDLRIVSGNMGTPGTKNENVISSLNVESMCGVLQTSPGGISEKDMKFITGNIDDLIGKIVEVKCSGVSQDSEGNYALLHPVFKKIRDDKHTGDDLTRILEIEAGAKGLS